MIYADEKDFIEEVVDEFIQHIGMYRQDIQETIAAMIYIKIKTNAKLQKGVKKDGTVSVK